MKQVYFIEIDLENEDIKDILKEYDSAVNVRYTRFKSLDEYDMYQHYNEVLGV